MRKGIKRKIWQQCIQCSVIRVISYIRKTISGIYKFVMKTSIYSTKEKFIWSIRTLHEKYILFHSQYVLYKENVNIVYIK